LGSKVKVWVRLIYKKRFKVRVRFETYNKNTKLMTYIDNMITIGAISFEKIKIYFGK